jgi:predicted 3-demethylubiquinone-9 3-methyltransferase (glyoxalase superfamily)
MPTITQKITPFLWFDHQAEEAANFYVSLFENSRITAITHYGEGAPLPKGTVLTVAFELAGQKFVALNGGPLYHFTEAISFVVNCETQAEIDRFWDKLSDAGSQIQCGWLKDKYGLSWQVVPAILSELLDGRDPQASQRVMQAIMQMTKLDIDGLKRAYQCK